MSDTGTHGALVQIAKRWLKNTIGCSVTLAEFTAAGGDIPDAIGWKGGWSWLVECKTSRSDFRADLKKPQRQPFGWALGCSRYFLAPRGLLKEAEIPRPWGLLEWTGSRVLVTLESACTEREQVPDDYHEIRSRELYLAISALRRKYCSRCFGEMDQRTERLRDSDLAEAKQEIRSLKRQLRWACKALEESGFDPVAGLASQPAPEGSPPAG